MRNARLRYVVTGDGSVVRARLAGDIDRLVSAALDELRATLRGQADVIVDLRDVTFAGGALVSFLVELRRDLARCGGRLTLAALPRQVARAWARLGLVRAFPVEMEGTDGARDPHGEFLLRQVSAASRRLNKNP